MDKFVFLLLLFFSFNVSAQQVHFFDKDYQEVSQEEAKYYEIYTWEDEVYSYEYFTMDSVISRTIVVKDSLSEHYDSYYDGEGKLKRDYRFVDGIRQGESLGYDANGEVITRGLYVDDKEIEGDFFVSNYIIESYQNGHMYARKAFYSNSNNVACEFGFYSPEEMNSVVSRLKSVIYYGQDGEVIGELSLRMGQRPNNGLAIEFYEDNQGAISIKVRESFVDGKREGERIYYNEDGSVFVQGMYKNDHPLEGEFFEYLIKSSYHDGVKQGEEILYNKDMSIKSKTIFKDGSIYEGVKEHDNVRSTFKGGEEVERVEYFTSEKQKIKTRELFLESGSDKYFYNYDGEEIGRCLYKDEMPFKGVVADNNLIFEGDDEGDKGKQYVCYLRSKTKYANGHAVQIISFDPMSGKELVCTYKDGSLFEGEVYDGELNTYSKGKLVQNKIFSFGNGGMYFVENQKNDIELLQVETYSDQSIFPVKKVQYVDGLTYEMTYDGLTEINGYGFVNNELVHIVDGLKQGEFLRYENGKVVRKGNYVDGLKEGKVTYFPEEGGAIECIYLHDEPYEGVDAGYYSRVTYANGMRNGISSGDWNRYKESTNYVNDKRHGMYKFENDTLSLESEYRNDLPYDGKFYNTHLGVFEEYVEGRKQGLFYEKKWGEIKVFREYDQGDLLWQKLVINIMNPNSSTWNEWLSKDSVISNLVFQDGTPYEGVHASIDDDDEVLFTPYTEGIENGLQKRYEIYTRGDQEWKLVESQEYVDGKKEGEHYLRTLDFNDEILELKCTYKMDTPYEGDVITKLDGVKIISHYVKGTKHGNEKYIVGYDQAILNYDRGEIVEGESFEMITLEGEEYKITHEYKNGKKILSRCWLFQQGVTTIEYQSNGFSMETGSLLAGIRFENSDHSKGTIVFKDQGMEVGRFSFDKGSIITGTLIRKDEEGNLEMQQFIDGDTLISKSFDAIHPDLYYQDTSTTIIEGGGYDYKSFVQLHHHLSNKHENDHIWYYLGGEKLCELYQQNDQITNGILVEFSQYSGGDYSVVQWEDGESIRSVNHIEYNQIKEIVQSFQK